MATTKRHRTAGFNPTTEQAAALETFWSLVDGGTLPSKRKQCKWLFTNADMTVGDIAVYLDIRFQQVYQATR